MALGAILARLSLDNTQFKKELNEVIRIGDNLSRLGSKLSIGLSLPIVAFGKVSGEAFAQYDSLRRGLDTITGSAQATGKRLEELRKLALAPGLGFQEAIQGDVRLRAVGVSAAQSSRILKEFGNTIAQTGGGSAELNSVTVQLGQLIAKGKVYAQDLKPIIEAAPAVGRALKELYGTVDSESIQRNLADANKNSVAFIDDLLDKLAQSPRVAGGFKNALENIKDSLFVFTAKIGETTNNVFNLDTRLESLATRIGVAADKFQALPVPLQKFIIGATGVTAAAGPLLFVLGKLPGLFLEILKGKDAMIGFFLRITKALSIPTDAGFLKAFQSLGRSIPIVTAAAVILTAVFRNLGPIGESIGNLVKYFNDLYKEVALVRNIVDGLAFTFNLFFKYVDFAMESLIGLVEEFGKTLVGTFGTVGEVIKAALSNEFGSIPGIIKKSLDNGIKEFESFRDRLLIGFVNFINDLDRRFNNIGKKQFKIAGARGIGGYERVVAEDKPAEDKTDKTVTATDKFSQAIKKLNEELLRSTNLQKIYGTSFDGVGEKIAAYQQAIDELAGLSQPRANAKIQEFVNEILKLQPAVAKIDNLSRVKTDIESITTAINNLFPKKTIDIKVVANTEDINKSKTAFADFQLEVKKAQDLARSIGPDFDLVGAKMSALNGFANKLASEGLPLSTEQFAKLKKEMSGGGGGNSLSSITKEVGEAFSTLAGRINVQSIWDTDLAVSELNMKLNEQAAILRDPTATEAQKKAAQVQIELTKRQIQVEKDKGNVFKQVGREVYNTVREIIKARLAEAIAGLLAKELGTKGILGLVTGGIGAGLAVGLFEALVPKLAQGGLAYSPVLALVGDNKNAKNDPEVISPLSKLKAMLMETGGGGGGEIYGRLSGVDLLLSNRYTEQYYARVS
jgi:tape measure domain-containing protein